MAAKSSNNKKSVKAAKAVKRKKPQKPGKKFKVSRKSKSKRVEKSKRRRRAIGDFIVNKRSLVPNIITMSNMTMGFFAIIFASRGDEKSLALAGILVIVGSLFDAFDGAVARAMHVESPVGVQLDSLADGIAYGVAPAVIAYKAYLSKLPQGALLVDSGMLIALIYPICAIYRLARFNISAEDNGHTGFSGLPSPAAGIFIATIPCLNFSVLPYVGKLAFVIPLEVFIPIYVIVSLLMVSRIDYSKIFSVIYKKGKSILILTVILIILLIGLFQMWSVFIVSSIYITWGIVNTFIKFSKKSKSGTAKKN